MLKNYYSIYKYGNWLVQHHVPVLPAVLKLVSRIFFPACDIPFTAKIGKNAYFPHRAIGVVIHENAVIGENARIQANVVIGGKGQSGVPTIGNNVQIGANAVIAGGGRDRRQCNRRSRSSGSERCSGSVCSVWSTCYGCEKVGRREMRIA